MPKKITGSLPLKSLWPGIQCIDKICPLSSKDAVNSLWCRTFALAIQNTHMVILQGVAASYALRILTRILAMTYKTSKCQQMDKFS